MEDIDKLIDWFERNGNVVRFQPQTTLPREQFLKINDRISNIYFYIKNDFPEYAERIIFLKNTLVLSSGFINVATFGRLSELLSAIKIILTKRECTQWKYIHYVFHKETKEKFLHGFYSDAVFTATKILMQRLKVIHREIDSTGCDIDGLDLVGKLFPNDNPKIFFTEQNTRTEQNIQKGYSSLFRGWVYAIRNKDAHEIKKGNEIEAFQEIVFISMLMLALDNRISPAPSPSECYT